jgi:TRAP-type mannitol/chloroaromatic compound transport system substrate-binding protein
VLRKYKQWNIIILVFIVTFKMRGHYIPLHNTYDVHLKWYAAFVWIVLLIGGTVTFMVLYVNASGEQRRTVLKCQSNYDIKSDLLGRICSDFVRDVNSYNTGMRIEPMGPGGYVPVKLSETQVADGYADCVFTGLGYSVNGDKTLQLLTSIPFGSSANSYLSYILHGGGLQKLNTRAKTMGLYVHPMALLPPETGGWYTTPIISTANWSSVRMRIYGMAREIITRLNGTAVFLAQNEIIEAITSGTINAAEFSSIEVDAHMGLPEVLDYWYAPAWNQPATVLYFVVNFDVWTQLGNTKQERIQEILIKNMYSEYMFSVHAQYKYYVQYNSSLQRFPEPVLNDMRNAWTSILSENIDVKNEYDEIMQYEREYEAYLNAMRI